MGNLCSTAGNTSPHIQEKKRTTKNGKSKKGSKPSNPGSTATLKARPKVTTPQAQSPKVVPHPHKESIDEHDPNGGTLTPHQDSFSKDVPTTPPTVPPGTAQVAEVADVEKLSPTLQAMPSPVSTNVKNPLDPSFNFTMDQSTRAVAETSSLHTCPSTFSDDDWSRKVSQDDQDGEWQRKFSNFTEKDDSRHNSVGSSTTHSSSASEQGGRVTASKKSRVPDSCTSSVVDGSTVSMSRVNKKAEEKFLRRRMKALLLWIKTLQLPPYDDIRNDGFDAAVADSEPFDMDSERRFSKLE